MKELFIALCAIFAVSVGIEIVEMPNMMRLLGPKRCTWKSSYLCQNLTYAAECKATSHCIAKIWKNMQVPEDNDSVCKVCKDMVQQARDQLESNETQEDLKHVFEGSCALIRVKAIVKECDKLVDDFVPDLVETLASQMNPNVVCTVAGLCNSKRIDRMLLEQDALEHPKKDMPKTLKNDELQPSDCFKCYTIANHMKNKFNNVSKDNFANGLLTACGNMGSHSDACSSIVLTYFDSIYNMIDREFASDKVCHLVGRCSDKFHVHESDQPLKVDVRPLSSVGMVEVNDDLPCELCQQLVVHLKDLLTANTTEEEFKMVLEGLCRQTKSFADQCKSIVNEYYPEIYAFLTQELDGKFVCRMGGICPSPNDESRNSALIAPLVTDEAMKASLRIFKLTEMDTENVEKNPQNLRAEEMQLPIERLQSPGQLIFPNMNVEGQTRCEFCEYFLHYMQIVLTNPRIEDQVEAVIDRVCKKFPDVVENECMEFVKTYGDALVALLVEEIDPSQLCPMIGVCPSEQSIKFWESLPRELMIESNVEEKPSCPLCLLAVTDICDALKNNRTEKNIQYELKKLCSHLPSYLYPPCNDFVNTYSQQLIELLLSDLKPEEICTVIKLCNDTQQVGLPDTFPNNDNGEILTNEIPDFPLEPESSNEEAGYVKKDFGCQVCSMFIHYVEKEMQDKKTRDDIEKIIHGVCSKLPRDMENKCDRLVQEYGDMIIQLLADEISPKEVCALMGACELNDTVLQKSVAECALCRTMNSILKTLLQNQKNETKIEDVVSQVCSKMPSSGYEECKKKMSIYKTSIINIIKDQKDLTKDAHDLICEKMALCSEKDYYSLNLMSTKS